MLKYAVILFLSALIVAFPQKKKPNKHKDKKPKAKVEKTVPGDFKVKFPEGFDSTNIPKDMKKLLEKPLYKFTEEELGQYLGFLQQRLPDLRKRVQFLAKQMIGQPYKIYLLGEFPFELYDKEPLYTLKNSDCVVFSEHIYAMALSHNWKEFFAMLQRIRYKDGEIGMLTRNHYTEADWDKNNSWLITEITDEIGGDAVVHTSSEIDRAKFFKKHNIGQDIPVQKIEWSYIPGDSLYKVLPLLKTGDFVNIVRAYPGKDPWVGHVGLISVENDTTVNFIHSAEPQVRSQTILSFWDNWKKEKHKPGSYNFLGFRFFRLNENAMENLKKIDGEKAPKVTIYGN
ncbi:MAG: DUF1460 domain-containing protein [Ignavibacteriales bacterium]|nr:MAG: DUF1460 domain-containing protein [Ignavibacteriaceae bacterium]MBW7872795.1 DUF1460 domain-containing protein [Ignavibacteria bacterium]MCZ2143515.1 DUF1460 domain-containing protein [Ignavibacteriales bacterium]OQY74126.1 MAG: hypothetical protein B6D45_07200 [Ignavibacteriales bacterium UTCHB3]MBV6444392.1 hypothetical protein [Ignavibacteriaceae bacterium]